LLDGGDTAVGLDSLSTYYDVETKRANLAALASPRFEFIEGDINTANLDDIFATGIEAVVHLAGQPGVRLSWGSDFSAYTADNVDATQTLLEASVRHGVLSRFVYASSSSVYGQAETFPTREDMLPAPFSPYGVTKLAGEHLTSAYVANFGLPATSFRFFTVYGRGQRPDMAFSRFFRAARDEAAITVFGDGSQVRDFTHVSDICAALIGAIYSAAPLPQVMNLAGGSSVSVTEVLQTIESIVGKPLILDYRPAVKGDVTRTGGDIRLARESLDWSPRVSLATGLQEQWEWIRGS
jgi:UDP-glucuronate 4-epimerase